MIDYISEYTLKYSLTNRCVVAIFYIKDTEITQRKVKVLKIDNDIIKVIDADKRAIRIFKKENILSAMRLK